MKTRYELITFKDRRKSPTGKTWIYTCYMKEAGDPIGFVQWYSRGYAFIPVAERSIARSILGDICNFIDQLNKEWANETS